MKTRSARAKKVPNFNKQWTVAILQDCCHTGGSGGGVKPRTLSWDTNKPKGTVSIWVGRRGASNRGLLALGVFRNCSEGVENLKLEMEVLTV